MLFHLPVLPRPGLLLQRHGAAFSPVPSQPRKAFLGARCCHGWECQGILGWEEANRASSSGKNGDDDESSQGLWISAPALGAAAVCILAYRCIPWGLRILGFVPVIAIFGVRLRSASLLEKVRPGLRMLGNEVSSLDRSLEGFFSGDDTRSKRRKKQEVSFDLPAIHGCLHEIEGVVSSMKKKNFDQTKDDIAQLEQVLESLKQLVLLDAASKTSENGAVAAEESKIKVNAGTDLRLNIPDDSSSLMNASVENEDSNIQSPEETSNADLKEKEAEAVTGDIPASHRGTIDEDLQGDHVFNLKLQEADALIREGRGAEQVEAASKVLEDAVRVLQTAVAMKPNNLVAVGMLANALLAHGQVKLKVANELKSNSIGNSEIAAERLRQICQGCEDLLVEAGRTYRRALLIDRKDVRALHNWGVALCSRAELLALDEGTSWQEVEKVYLAAIDKFEALVGLGQDHAAPALLHWALAVRNRARLRDRGSIDRINLLLQAQQLLCDAAALDPKDQQVKVEACGCQEEIEELERLHLGTWG